MPNSSRLNLLYLQPSQSQKHVTVNEALRRLDAVVQLSVVSATIAAQPGSPADGDCYILPTGKTGAAWGAMTNLAVAYYVDGAWSQITPREGFAAWVADANQFVVYDGAAWGEPGAAMRRELLTANRTYYVRTDGSDSNNGLANTVGGAFLTIQKAIDVAASLDLGVYNVTIRLADGTYATTQTLKTIVGAGSVTIEGNLTTPANVLINATGSAFSGTYAGAYTLRGMKIAASVFGISVSGGILNYDTVDFGACSIHVMAQVGAIVTATGNYTISGAAGRHWLASRPGAIIAAAGITLTITGTPAFSAAFAQAEELASVRPTSITFSGAATGSRYRADSLGLVQTNGGGATYLPGDSAGSTSAGGQYA